MLSDVSSIFFPVKSQTPGSSGFLFFCFFFQGESKAREVSSVLFEVLNVAGRRGKRKLLLESDDGVVT